MSMAAYSFTVVIDDKSYRLKAGQPWTAITRAIMKHHKECPKDSLNVLTIHCLNITNLDKLGLVGHPLRKLLKEAEAVFMEKEPAIT